jgi:phenylalanyl-tRNA synthetase alpha chain
MYRGEERVAQLLASKGSATLEEIAQELSISLDTVRKFVESLKAQGFVATEKKEEEIITTTSEFRQYRNGESVLPEYSVFKKALEGNDISHLDEKEKRYGLGWAKKKGYIEIERGVLKPLKTIEEVQKETERLLLLFDRISSGEKPTAELLEELLKRDFIKVEKKATVVVKWIGKEIPKEVVFDISTEGPDAPIGKAHPLTALTTKIKRIFIELGFEEMEGSIVESAFWNFDALFQPQDHPARDLADTFYLSGESELPDKKIVERVKKAHESGWRYQWSEKEARRRVLRTHTTALSARALASLKDNKPKKFFAIGRVFRNEATDATHLAEFYQVEGIVVWEKATFRHLLGILKEFYKRLGFEKIRFRPSYFPYTEPSVEIEVFLDKRQEWLEMGGAGIFRPEVSVPLANIYPVLAWGLSLERPLMLLLDLNDIRTLYRNDMNFLKSTRIW